MPNLNSIVQITVNDTPRGITQRGFGTPMILGKHTAWAALSRTFSGVSLLTDLVAAGILPGTPIYRAANALAAQTNKPQYVKIGKLGTSFNQTFTLTIAPGSVYDGKSYAFSVEAPNGGAVTDIAYTISDATPTEDEVATAIAALIGAITDITATATLHVISCVADDPDAQWYVHDLSPDDIIYEDTTIDSALAADYALIKLVDNDFYGVLLADCQSNARMTALAAVTETEEKILGYTTHDALCGDPTEDTDVMFELNAASYDRTFGIYSGNQGAHASGALMGFMLPQTPGKYTAAFRSLSGITSDTNLQPAFTLAIETKKGNTYTTVQGIPIVWPGCMSSGEWLDIIIGRDHFVQRCRERIFTLLTSVPKVPYTNAGIAMVVAQLYAQATESTAYGFLDPERPAVIVYPDAASVSAANKINRILPDISVTVYIAGAVHTVALTVTLAL